MARWCSGAPEIPREAFKPLRTGGNPILQQDTNEKGMPAALPITIAETVDDSSDVALAASGDRRAFERLYRKHSSRVFSLCVRMSGSSAKGEELTQDVFV